MDQETKDITYSSGSIKAEITVKRGNVLDGLRRGQAMFEASEETDNMAWYARYWIYSTLVGATKAITVRVGNKKHTSVPEFKEFLTWPNDLVETWLAAAYELNPAWLPVIPDNQLGEADREDREKKAPPPTSG